MLNKLKKAANTTERILVKRNYEPPLLLNPIQQKILQNNGFVHIKNAITQDEIAQLNQFYFSVSENKTFEKQPYYFNSVSFQDKPIRKKNI